MKKPITLTSNNAHYYLNLAVEALNRSVKPGIYNQGYIGKLEDVVTYLPTMTIHQGLQHRADTNHLYRGNQARVVKLKLKYDKEKNIYSATAPRRTRQTPN